MGAAPSPSRAGPVRRSRVRAHCTALVPSLPVSVFRGNFACIPVCHLHSDTFPSTIVAFNPDIYSVSVPCHAWCTLTAEFCFCVLSFLVSCRPVSQCTASLLPAYWLSWRRQPLRVVSTVRVCPSRDACRPERVTHGIEMTLVAGVGSVCARTVSPASRTSSCVQTFQGALGFSLRSLPRIALTECSRQTHSWFCFVTEGTCGRGCGPSGPVPDMGLRRLGTVPEL